MGIGKLLVPGTVTLLALDLRYDLVMVRYRGIFLLLFGLLQVFPALADERVDYLRLTAPAGGQVLVAGSLAELAWEPGADLEAWPRAREWEAFLSLNGGETFPLRITPHLELSENRVSFRVPQLAAEDVRILLRVGDETEERSQPVPFKWRIVSHGASVIPVTQRVLQAADRGEAARPGDEGVWSWMEASGDGRWVEYQSVPDPRAFHRALPERVRVGRSFIDSRSERERFDLASRFDSEISFLTVAETRQRSGSLLRSRPILILVQRFNE